MWSRPQNEIYTCILNNFEIVNRNCRQKLTLDNVHADFPLFSNDFRYRFRYRVYREYNQCWRPSTCIPVFTMSRIQFRARKSSLFACTIDKARFFSNQVKSLLKQLIDQLTYSQFFKPKDWQIIFMHTVSHPWN